VLTCNRLTSVIGGRNNVEDSRAWKDGYWEGRKMAGWRGGVLNEEHILRVGQERRTGGGDREREGREREVGIG
jgi:hypothetical protein